MVVNMDDIIIFQKEPWQSMISIREEDNYHAIWLSLSPSIDIDKPIKIYKRDGSYRSNRNFYKELARCIAHESVHLVIIKLENLQASADYDNVYHYFKSKYRWSLP